MKSHETTNQSWLTPRDFALMYSAATDEEADDMDDLTKFTAARFSTTPNRELASSLMASRSQASPLTLTTPPVEESCDSAPSASAVKPGEGPGYASDDKVNGKSWDKDREIEIELRYNLMK